MGGGGSKTPAPIKSDAERAEELAVEVERLELTIKMCERRAEQDSEQILGIHEAHTNLKKYLYPGIAGAAVFGAVLGWGVAKGSATSKINKLNGAVARLTAEIEATHLRGLKNQEAASELTKRKFALRTLGIADDFDRAENLLANPETVDVLSDDASQILEGIRMTGNELHKAYADFNIYRLERSKLIGNKFDPEWHEAVSTIQSDDPNSIPGSVVDVLMDGYSMDSKLLRAARVIVEGEPVPPKEVDSEDGKKEN